MKKTLAAVAVLGAFAASASADVSVYGRFNTSLHVLDQNIEMMDAGGMVKVDKTTWDMATGDNTGARFGFKGSEKIADGLTAGFVLEAGFKGDTGAGDFFGREAIVYLGTDYGTFAAGKMGTVVGSAGSWATFASHATFEGTGTSGLAGTGLFANAASRWGNMLAYKSPVMGGFQVLAQYSMGDATDNESVDNNRYAALAAKYQAGALTLVAAVDQVNKEAGVDGDDDAYTFNFGGNYDFGPFAISAGAQYFKGKQDIAGMLATNNANNKHTGGVTNGYKTTCVDKGETENAEGFGVTFGLKAPVAGGNFHFSTTYVEGDADVVVTTAWSGSKKDLDKLGLNTEVASSAAATQEHGTFDFDAKAWNVGVMYDYNLSKNTYVYGSVAYTKYEADSAAIAFEQKKTEAYVGLVHKF